MTTMNRAERTCAIIRSRQGDDPDGGDGPVRAATVLYSSRMSSPSVEESWSILPMLRSIITAVGLAAFAACAATSNRPEHSTEPTQPTSREQRPPTRPGDPYILALVDRIGDAWILPAASNDAGVADASATVCLTIAETGVLESYRVIQWSGNEQFDRSVDAALSAIKHLPPPPDRDLATPRGPMNLRYLATHGKLCPVLSPRAK